MARSILGLDIGTSAVRAAEVSTKSSPPTLVRFASVPLPRGAMDEGEIVDHAVVVAAIKELMGRGRFSVRRAAIGIANQKVVVRQIDMPQMDETELRGALQFQAQEHIPIPIEDAILDFPVIEEFGGSAGEPMMKVLLVAAQRDMVSTFVSAASAAGLDPAAVDLSPLANLRSVGSTAMLLGTPESEVVIDIGAGLTNITVHEQGKPRFVRILAMGGEDISDALVSSLGVEWEEAEGLKARIGLVHEAASEPVEKASELIEQRSAAFIDEVRGSIDYYLSQADSTRITTAVVTGGASKLPGLLDRLAAALHIPVDVGRPLERVRVANTPKGPGELEQMSSVAAVAVGLAVREA